jgi:hypothetical protein
VNLRIVLAIVVITGLLLSVSSVYLNKLVFADDNWSDIAARQQAEEQRAMVKYTAKYQYANVEQSKKDWSGLLTGATTDETSRGRQIDEQSKVSLENALAQFDQIHVKQLVDLQASGYQGLTNTPTDTQGRDRNTLIGEAQNSSMSQAQEIVSQLNMIDTTYTNFESTVSTDENSYDRQAQINEKWSAMESKASSLVNNLAKIDSDYLSLSGGPTTNEKTNGRQLSAAQAYALEKAVAIFDQIHEQRLSHLHASYYGLTNTPTDEQGKDRNAMLEQARATSMQNALRVYNAYYQGTGLQ